MRRLNISAIFSAALLLAAVSCTPENLREAEDCIISINLSSKSLETKATKQGEDLFNENIISSVYYFFYKDGDESAAPVVKGCVEDLDHKSGVRTEKITVAPGLMTTLFDSSNECLVFIVANPPQGLETFLEGTPTLSKLRSELFLTDLDGIQDSFTMIFDSKASKTAEAGEIMTVEANLKRLANKFTVSLQISDRASGETEWVSVPADAKVEFHNAFKETALGGDFAAVKAGDSDYGEQYFSTGAIDFGEPVAGKDDADNDIWKCTTEHPAYTYSMSWDFSGSREPYLIIELPWRNSTSGETQLTYYKVLFNSKELTINNWCHLNVELSRLGGYHKDDPVQVFEDMKYLVLDWNSAYDDGYGPVTDIDAARYLMMNQTEYFLYNQETWNFPYTTSHECEIVLETYEKPNFRTRRADVISGNSREMGLDSEGNPIYDCTLDGSLITFYHKINNDFTSTEEIDGINYGNYDVVPYTFKLTIRHKDNHAYKQEVIVHQYPAIYIEAQANSAGVVLDESLQSTCFIHINPELMHSHEDDDPFCCYDEGDNPVDFHDTEPGVTYYKYKYFGYGADFSSYGAGNSNGNMYLITTATPPVIDGQECLLADPREFASVVDAQWKKDCNEQGESISIEYNGDKEITIVDRDSRFGKPAYPLTEEDDDIFEEAPALYGASPRTLTWYYPTRSTKDAENIIAPKLRVASSWGQTQMLSYDKAVRRCAAYQEDGYPAGRWRVPTKAEVMYICKLSSDHVIPQLFGQYDKSPNVAAKYWCSTGIVGVYKVEESDGTLLNAYHAPVYTFEIEHEYEADKTTAVRCVYDEWYWENRDSDGAVKTTGGRLPESDWDNVYWGDMPR